MEISDFPENDLVSVFNEMCAFIDDAQRFDSKILVHCLRGVNRSSAMILAYLIYSKRWRLEQAYDFLKRKHLNMKPNIVLLGRLIKFEESILGPITKLELDLKYPYAAEDLRYLRITNKSKIDSTNEEVDLC